MAKSLCHELQHTVSLLSTWWSDWKLPIYFYFQEPIVLSVDLTPPAVPWERRKKKKHSLHFFFSARFHRSWHTGPDRCCSSFHMRLLLCLSSLFFFLLFDRGSPVFDRWIDTSALSQPLTDIRPWGGMWSRTGECMCVPTHESPLSLYKSQTTTSSSEQRMGYMFTFFRDYCCELVNGAVLKQNTDIWGTCLIALWYRVEWRPT